MKNKDDLPKLKVTERIAGNANNISQPRFHSTEKKGRPKKAPISYRVRIHQLKVAHLQNH
jgi:hypothetical protein